ncbi:MAG: iron-containing alcohol dehydrogenase [Erysipelotrichaceae bacterium]|nr:iron-containing alcohol dehydrogenase [Erysipelotrichaceae bacterium]
MKNFIYNTPTKIFFGKGYENKLGEILSSYNTKKVLLHYGKSSVKKTGLYDLIINQLNASKIDFVELGGVSPNPKLSLVLEGVKMCKKENVDLILAVGGGSVIDSAKSISNGAMVDHSPWLFNIKEKESKNHIPVGVILTHSAAGSEMSNSCVITNDDTLEKRGFSSEENRCLFAIMNPELTYTVNEYQTACGIVDILMHTLERYLSLGDATPITDNIALGLMKSVIEAGRIVMKNPKDYNARATLMWASSLSHNGLTGTGREYVMSVHQIEHELSGMFDEISHGAGLAALWPSWAMISYNACPERFLRLAYEVMDIPKTEDSNADIIACINQIKLFFKSIGMPTCLRELNVPKEALNSLAMNSMFNGKRVLEDVVTVDYEKALEILNLAYL